MAKVPIQEIILNKTKGVSRAEDVKKIILTIIESTSTNSYEEAGIVKATFADGSYIDFTMPEVRVK